MLTQDGPSFNLTLFDYLGTKRFAAQKMYVEVWDKLAAMLAFVENQTISLFNNAELLSNFISNNHHFAKQFGCRIMHAKNMLFGKNDYVNGGLRLNIFFDDKIIVLIDNSFLR